MEQIKRQTRWITKTHWQVILGFFFVGIISLLMSHTVQHQAWTPILEHVGIALIVAAILAGTIEGFIRKDLIDDAFRASVGYILPAELKGEMEWIYNCHIICVEHVQRCELRSIDEETCQMYMHTQRTLRNVSGSKENAKIRVEINEWFHGAAQSKIASFGYIKGQERWEATEKDIAKGEDATIRTMEQSVPLAPSEEFTFWHETEEIKRVIDEQCWVYLYPTLNPLVSIKAPDGFQTSVEFGHRVLPVKLDDNTYRLPGTLLSDQLILIRWWKKEEVKKWFEEGIEEGLMAIASEEVEQTTDE